MVCLSPLALASHLLELYRFGLTLYQQSTHFIADSIGMDLGDCGRKYLSDDFWAKSMPVSIRKIMILTSSLCQESSFWQRLNAKTRLLLLTTVYLSTELAPGLFRYGYRLLLAQATGCSLGSKIRHGVLGIGLV